MHLSADFVALCVVGAVALGNAFGLLDRLGIKNRSASDAAAELEIKDSKIERLERRAAELERLNRKLENERSLKPILEQIHANAEIQAQVLDRLVHHNGAFRHMEESLRTTEESLRTMAEGLKLVTGFIAGVIDLPMKEKP